MRYCDEAVLYAKHIVPSLDGDADETVPPGSQSDKVLRLMSRGLPYCDRGDYGDLCIRLQVKIPSPLSTREGTLPAATG
jgi:molecular chaperone DnaJ